MKRKVSETNVIHVITAVVHIPSIKFNDGFHHFSNPNTLVLPSNGGKSYWRSIGGMEIMFYSH